MAKRCALALLCVGVLPVAAEDAVWSGAAPAAAFTGSATTAHAADSHAATVLPPMRSQAVQHDAQAPKPTDGTRTATVADEPASGSTTESRLASGWVLAMLVAGVVGCGALACYAMGFFSCGNQRAARKKRVVVMEEPRDEESALPTHMEQPLVQQSVVPAVAAPLSAYQVVSSPAPVLAPMTSINTYYAAPAMAASVAAPSAAYAAPQASMYSVAPPIAPQASMYSVAPPIAAPEPMPFLPTEPLPVR